MKKKGILIFLVILMMFLVTPVNALNIASCENSIEGVIIDEKIPNIISTIVTVIKIAVPVLLVIFGMLDLAKGMVAQKEDEIKKGQKLLVKRLIAGALVFLVFIIVQLLISFVASDEENSNIMTCASCFINGDCTYSKVDGKCPKGTKKENGHCVK